MNFELLAAVDNIIELNERLIAMTKQRDGFEAKLRTELRGHQDSELWRGDAGLIAATMRFVDAVEKLTEQRDRMRKRIAQLEDELAKTCNKVEELAEIGLDQMDKERSIISKLSDYKNQRDRLGMALQKLADCDWVITLPDRMDAVRAIANEALQSLTPTQPEPK